MDTDARRLIREVTDVVATATESGARRTTGEPLPLAEQVALQRRKVLLLRDIAARSTQECGVREVLAHAERRLRQLASPVAAVNTRKDRTDAMTGPNIDRNRLLAVNAEAQRYFRKQLLTSPAARGPCQYLTQRRLAHVLAADSPWLVGYAPAGWTRLTGHLRQAGFSHDELVAAGVAGATRRGGVVDRFRDRIILPQRTLSGEVVGFIGRAAPGAPTHAPKYLNSPHTDVYNKSRLLFGLHEQREALARGCRPVLVEGPLDVLAVAAAQECTIPSLAGMAPCGTALTAEQVALLADHTSSGSGAVVAYDNDQAGRRSTAAAYNLLSDCDRLTSGHLTAATLPRGTDPADVLQVHGPHALRSALADRTRLTPLGQRVIDAELLAWAPVLDGAEGRIAAVKAVAPLIARLPSFAVAEQVARLADHVSLDPTTVTIALTDALAGGKHCNSRRRGPRSSPNHQVRGPLPPCPTYPPWRHAL